MAAVYTSPSGGDDLAELAAAQSCGPSELADMYRHVSENIPITAKDVELPGYEFKCLSILFEKLSLDKHGVMRVMQKVGRRTRQCAIASRQWQWDLIWRTHSLNHAGFRQTETRLRLDWFWIGMTGDIRRQVATCCVCQAAKHSKHTSMTKRQRLDCGRVWQVIAVDLLGPFMQTPRGNVMVLVVCYQFSRWRHAVALPSGTAPTVAKALENEIFCFFGVPEIILSDNRSQLKSKLMHELCQIWGCKGGQNNLL